MPFVALIPKLTIYILYGGDCHLKTQKPIVTCYTLSQSLLNGSKVLDKLYTSAGVHDMLGTNEMKGLELVHEKESIKDK